MRKQILIFSILLLLSLVSVGMTDYISKIEFSRPSPAVIELGDNLNVNFNYYTTNVGGLRIFVRPVTNGTLTPGYGAHGSLIYPAGSGAGSGFFNIGSGNPVVDHVRFQMYNADQSQLILEFYVPVEYHFSTHIIYDIQLSPPSPTSVPLNEKVNASFKYKTNMAGGVRIFVRPLTNGAGTPGYAAHGSDLYPTGSGNGTGFFTITTGDQIVTHVRFHMTNNSQNQTLLDFGVPVHYHFAAHSIANIKLNPDTPTAMLFNQNVNITFDYVTAEAGGVRIFARPFSGGNLTPGYGAHSSGIYPAGVGTGSGFFNIGSGSTVVDHIRLQMMNASQSQVLFEMMVPVQYPYSDHAITDIAFSPSPAAYLTLNQDLNFKFSYKTNQVGGVRIFGRPMTNGALTPGYGAHGSGVYPSGSGNGSGFFNIQSGAAKVDHIRFRMENADQSKILLDLFVPVDFFFGMGSPTNVNESAEQHPLNFQLAQNYPNPFNSSTAIDYQIADAAIVEITIFNALGQKITTLANEWQTTGQHQILWNGKDDAGKAVANGIYFYQLKSGNFTQIRKMLLVL